VPSLSLEAVSDLKYINFGNHYCRNGHTVEPNPYDICSPTVNGIIIILYLDPPYKTAAYGFVFSAFMKRFAEVTLLSFSWIRSRLTDRRCAMAVGC